MFKSNKFSGNLTVQYNIWLNGNKKLRKNKVKQKENAKKEGDKLVSGNGKRPVPAKKKRYSVSKC